MTKTVEAKMVISAYDRTAGAFGPIMKRMRDMEGATKRMAAANRQMAALTSQQATMNTSQLMGTLATVAATLGVVRRLTEASKAAMELEKAYSTIGKTAGISAAEAAKLGLSLGDAAGVTGRSVKDMLEGTQALVAAGNDVKDAFNLAPTMATIANATDASIADVAKSTSALLQNLGVTSSQILETWDKISATTKAGSFEARDIAQYLPAVSASAAKLGIVGPQGAAKLAAALQVTRTATGDASSAANNLVNLMEKIYAPDTKRNIDKHLGPQAWRGFQKSVKNGTDDLTAFVDMLEKGTKGDLTKLPALMPDAQARSALSALIGKAQMYDDVLRSASTAQGTIMKDAAEQAKLAASAWERLAAASDTYMTRIGQKWNENVIAPIADSLAKDITAALSAETLRNDYMDEIEKRTGKRPNDDAVDWRFKLHPLQGDGTPEGQREAARRAAAADAYDANLLGISDPTTVINEKANRQARMAKLAAELADSNKGAENAMGFAETNPARIRAENEAKAARARLDNEITAQLPRLSTLDPGTFATPDEVIAKGYGDFAKSRAGAGKARPDLPLPRPRPDAVPTDLSPYLPPETIGGHPVPRPRPELALPGLLTADPSLFMDGPSRATEAAAMRGFDPSAFASSGMDDAARQASTAAAEVRALFDELRNLESGAGGAAAAFGSADVAGAVSQSMAGGVEAIQREGQRMETEAQATMDRIRKIFASPVTINARFNGPSGAASGLNTGKDVSGNGIAGAP